MNDLKDSIDIIKTKIRDASIRSGRTEDDVLLIGVTKNVDLERIRQAYNYGIRDFGENYVQEARKKIEAFTEGATWHMIGHIQTNKIKYISRLFQWVHSVDRLEVLEILNRYGREMKVLFELNISGEQSKHGASQDDVKRILEKVRTFEFIEPLGLMTMAPYVENPEDVRWIFRRMREMLTELNKEFGLNMKELSMGMSSDFEVAIEEGSTMVRIGTAIFGERH
ncbi:MAG: YggS family pyridoxal phosphate-dependent enzyme [Syntrophorhabdaceae bacterium]|nr:YggS family pyridoxal phosphate-dependent enzyme [Syntrophorhabdaceae bacterium]